MNLQTIIAFSLLLWWPHHTRGPDHAHVIAILAGQLVAVGLAAWRLSRRTVRRMAENRDRLGRALALYHRAAGGLRLILLSFFAYDVFAAGWPGVINSVAVFRAIPGAAPMAGLIPYVVGLLTIWWLLYPVERAARRSAGEPSTWSRRRFIAFNLRHHFLVLAVPLGLLLVAYQTTERYRAWFVRSTGTPWGPDVALGAAVAIIFVISPVIMRHVWTTSPLPDGPLRRRLLALCDRIGLRVRDILVWHSDRMMANAAVMGVIPRVRYILLSDALIEAMTDDEIEAVFGHEAGHVKHHHILYFIVFAVISLLLMQGVMELLFQMYQHGIGRDIINQRFVEVFGVVSVLPVWLLGFGAISRRFERQADVHGARCAAPHDTNQTCALPCGVHHHNPGGPAHSDMVCATGARTFISALRKVAYLNGIAIREWTWRHSSIAARMDALAACAADASAARAFARRIRRVKIALIATLATGLLAAGGYLWTSPRHRDQLERYIFQPLQQWIHGGGGTQVDR